MIQKLGRAGRDPTLQAHGYLLVEPSVFQKINSRKPGPKPILEDELEDAPDDILADMALGGLGNAEDDDEGATIAAPVNDEDAPSRYRKEIDPEYRQYIESQSCRREVLDKYFGNPPRLAAHDSAVCCDNCISLLRADVGADMGVDEGTLQELDDRTDSEAESSEEEEERSVLGSQNGDDDADQAAAKRPKTRRGEWLADAQELLKEFRFEIWARDFANSDLLPTHILSDKLLQHFANSCAAYTDIDDILGSAQQWHFAESYGREMLDALRVLDDLRAEELKAKADSRKEDTRLRREAQAAIQEAERREHRQAREIRQTATKAKRNQKARERRAEEKTAAEEAERSYRETAEKEVHLAPWRAPWVLDENDRRRHLAGPYRPILPFPTNTINNRQEPLYVKRYVGFEEIIKTLPSAEQKANTTATKKAGASSKKTKQKTPAAKSKKRGPLVDKNT